jgi:hypothetical protein
VIGELFKATQPGLAAETISQQGQGDWIPD